MEGDGDQTALVETDVLREEVPPQTSPGRLSPRGPRSGGLQSPPLC